MRAIEDIVKANTSNRHGFNGSDPGLSLLVDLQVENNERVLMLCAMFISICLFILLFRRFCGIVNEFVPEPW